MHKANILVIDDDRDILVSSEVLLENEGFNHFGVQHPKNAIELLKKYDIQIILLDMNFAKGETSGQEGILWQERFIKEYPDCVIIIITGYTDVELAVSTVKKGAFDFILKPWDNNKLLSTIYAALQLSKSKRDAEKLYNIQNQLKKDFRNEVHNLIGESDAIKKVKDEIAKVAKTEANVLIHGSSGSGKDLIARHIHQLSSRNNNLFYKVDLPSIQSSLFESELFGHEKGAFTDAKESKPGKFEIANEGSLYLDEITSVDMQQQTKLLSVLQNRQVVRLGSNQEREIDIRLICSTNKKIKNLITSGQFREDLFYRINTFEIFVPDLIERVQDIDLLANFYLQKYTQQYDKPKLGLSKRNIEKLRRYDWPGNVRELQNVIERAVILSEGDNLDFGSIFISGKLSFSGDDRSLNLAEMEKKFILQAIEKNKGNMKKAAEDLGLKRSSFYRRLEKYGIR